VQKISRLLEALTSEINHRSIAGLLAILVILLHLWVVVLLLQPANVDKKKEPLKIMEVALVAEPKPEPKKEDSPSAPAKPAPPKDVQPKKKEVKPPLKKKTPVIPKQVESPKIKEQKVADEQIPTPSQLLPSKTVEKPQALASPPQSAVFSKPIAKPGTGETKSKGENSGVVPLVQPHPAYPMRAQSRHIEGSVKIEFMVNASGSVSNPVVVSASPPGIFDEAALNNIMKWKFKPKMVNGNPVSQRTVQIIRFKLQ
jgi:periplasmic protein TonB